MRDVTQILSDIQQGDQHAAEQLLPLLYKELRKLAAQRLAEKKPGQTLQATAPALVHEAYLRPGRPLPRNLLSRSLSRLPTHCLATGVFQPTAGPGLRVPPNAEITARCRFFWRADCPDFSHWLQKR